MRLEGEEVKVVALGTAWVAAITSSNFLRIFTEGGLQVCQINIINILIDLLFCFVLPNGLNCQVFLIMILGIYAINFLLSSLGIFHNDKMV